MNEQQLIEQAQAGDQNAFGVLYLKYRKQSFNTAYRIVRERSHAEDIVQSSYVKAFKKIGQYNGVGPIGGWLHTLVRNAALNHYRDYGRREVQLHSCHVEAQPMGDVRFDLEDFEWLRAEIEKLPPTQQKVMKMHLAGKTHLDVMADMGCPYNTAKANYMHGLGKLKAAVGR